MASVATCKKLHITKPILIGFSIGGSVALEMASRAAIDIFAIVMLDSAIMLSDTARAKMRSYSAAHHHGDAVTTIKELVANCCLPTDKHREAVTGITLCTMHFVPSCKGTWSSKN